ncbi:2-keto-4-pentenoate hydratase [Spongiibacter sp. IMCC21906]|uniref:fumarylacetoacetate hydrolase family protein n=1 Tax=Spongiibacter sp. IMCC21906 TaxID=1620392 RepID=UPI00062DDA84|nr:fumarylacetoacetate hydrolase family protein [Spongiibacter sp. IMCC21906]AKH68082.1 2-keto-4-pentenoate hydratase [Spongiibacter sp. IMCC21906]
MPKNYIESIGDELYGALKDGAAIEPITDRYPDLSIDDAYKISLHFLSKRESDGERVIGKKIGVTSRAVQEMLGVPQPDFGFLTNQMLCESEADISNMIAPRAEGEIAFVLKSDLVGPGVSELDVLNATEWVMPCFEIVDSRIDNWKIKIQDTIADNASCGLFAVNQDCRIDPRTVDLVNCNMQVYKNGQIISEGRGIEAMGNPLTCVAWLANTLGKYGISLCKGDIILSGSLVPLEPVSVGDQMSLEISDIGSLNLKFVN